MSNIRDLLRLGGAVAMAAACLTAYGALAGPRWRARPQKARVVSQDEDTSAGPQAPPTHEVSSQVVRLDLDGGESVWAEVTRPQGEGPFPVVVFMHGAGTGNHTAFAQHTRELARRGVASICPDKRLSNYSARHRDYAQMAADAMVAVDFAHTLDWAGPVGMYAESESGWIAPMAAADNPDIAFMALVSSPVVRAHRQFQYAAGYYARNTHVHPGLFHLIPRLLGAPIPGGGFGYATTDVSVFQRRMRQPVFVAYGAADTSMPIVEGAAQVIKDLAAHGNHQVVVRYYAGANHGIRVGRSFRLAPQFLSDLASWVLSLPDGDSSTPVVAGPQVDQPFSAVEVPQVHRLWYTTVQAAIAVGALAACGIGAAVQVAERRVGRPLGDAQLRREAAIVGAWGVVTLASFGAYLKRIAVLALNYRTDDASVDIGYAGVRLMALAQVTAWCRLVREVDRRRALGLRLSAADWLTAAGAVAGGVALSGIEAYYCLFPYQRGPKRER